MKSAAKRTHDRRRPSRPAVGDVKPCPICANGAVQFLERCRLALTSRARIRPIPAWVCDQCPYLEVVRAEHLPSEVRKTARAARATANRVLMKARFVRGRADRVLQKSLRN